ncbi:hypothetical protein C7S16_0368 [Burkholderia thailandensis]|uniref:Uncharacterized protein n=1 Tax=Burkholderia thailandensis TaxID=57975 RepID=A0AAW9D394_BURTH|nr:hypothetical protein [Burkholderia thailandensis]MDW9256097.1 hypothetical protein [Burkholderia thailandensis]
MRRAIARSSRFDQGNMKASARLAGILVSDMSFIAWEM